MINRGLGGVSGIELGHGYKLLDQKNNLAVLHRVVTTVLNTLQCVLYKNGVERNSKTSIRK